MRFTPSTRWTSVALIAALVGAAASTVLPFQHASAATTGTSSIWSATIIPAHPDAPDGAAVEVGVKFRSSVAGSVTGVRFYKGAGNTGAHVGHLWTTGGVKLARADFVSETATGWQQVSFATPIAITANRDYIASYYTSSGHYADDPGFFASAGVDNGPLHALRDGADGPSGVYGYGPSGTFPASGWESSNYWVDVTFVAQPLQITTTLPGSSTTLLKPTTTLPSPTTTLPGSSTTMVKPTTTVPSPTTTFPSPTTTATTTPHSSVVSVRVSGNHLLDGSGNVIQLRGVNRSGAEFSCLGGSMFNGPTDAASVAVMASWHINSVRVPLNEDCWLGINGVSTAVSGSAYQSAIKGYVQTLHAAGLVVILDLHWNAPGGQQANGQQIMADADHSPAFWASVASVFKTDPGVIFDLYNEPHDISATCWRDGCYAGGFQTAGMQSLINAVRNAGATQPVMIGSLGWSGNFSQWLSYRPTDPANSIVASLHLYDFSGCITQACWDGTFGPVAAQFPIVTGELGETDCAHGFIDGYMPWADSHGVSYLGWTWNAGWSCSSGPTLINSYDGTPTAFGQGFKDHLAALG